ncbi:hypothetical protein HK096_002036, partial [Nowakowskiella sp. JEL0078]
MGKRKNRNRRAPQNEKVDYENSVDTETDLIESPKSKCPASDSGDLLYWNLGKRQKLSNKLQKYWHQRYSLFSRFDEGVWLDE